MAKELSLVRLGEMRRKAQEEAELALKDALFWREELAVLSEVAAAKSGEIAVKGAEQSMKLRQLEDHTEVIAESLRAIEARRNRRIP